MATDYLTQFDAFSLNECKKFRKQMEFPSLNLVQGNIMRAADGNGYSTRRGQLNRQRFTAHGSSGGGGGYPKETIVEDEVFVGSDLDLRNLDLRNLDLEANNFLDDLQSRSESNVSGPPSIPSTRPSSPNLYYERSESNVSGPPSNLSTPFPSPYSTRPSSRASNFTDESRASNFTDESRASNFTDESGFTADSINFVEGGLPVPEPPMGLPVLPKTDEIKGLLRDLNQTRELIESGDVKNNKINQELKALQNNISKELKSLGINVDRIQTEDPRVKQLQWLQSKLAAENRELKEENDKNNQSQELEDKKQDIINLKDEIAKLKEELEAAGSGSGSHSNIGANIGAAAGSSIQHAAMGTARGGYRVAGQMVEAAGNVFRRSIRNRKAPVRYGFDE